MYSLKQNLRYVFHHGYKNNKELFFTGILQVVCDVSVPLMGMLLPGFLIYFVEANYALETLLLYTLLYSILIAIVSYVSTFLGMRNDGLLIELRMLFSKRLAKKTISTSYENIESIDARNRIEKAIYHSVYSNEFGFEGITREVIKLLTNCLGFLIYCAILANVQPLMMIFIVLVSVLQIRVFSKSIVFQEQKKDHIVAKNRIFKYLQKECIDLKSAKDIRMFHMQPWLLSIFTKLKITIVDAFKEIQDKFLHADMKKCSLSFLRDAIAYAWLIYEVFHGLSIASFVIYMQAISGISNWLEAIVQSFNHLRIDHHGINDYRRYYESDDGLAETKDCMDNIKGEICFDHVSYAYQENGKEIIQDFNVTIHSGEKIALVGINGAGKTTLVKLLSGLYKPSKGTIYIDGKDMNTYSKEDIYKHISVVFQDVHLFAFSVAENVACTKKDKLDRNRVIQCLIQAGIYEKIMELNNGIDTSLTKILDEYGVGLSGGEMQKLMLARTLYHQGDILILDEPTAALDPIAESAIYENYNQLTNQKTSIFISHRLSSTRFCDRILFLKNGAILEEGTHAELMHKQGEYAHMFEVQSAYYKKGVDDDEHLAFSN